MTGLVEEVPAVSLPTGLVTAPVPRPVTPVPDPPRAPSAPVEVAVVSDAPVVRHGVSEMLRPWSERVRTTVRAWQSCEPVPADAVTLADTGPRATRAIALAEHPGRGPVLLLVRDMAPEEVHRALEAGCAGHVDLGASASDLLAAIENASLTPCSPTAERWPGKGQGLSRREAEVLVLVCRGLTNQDIAQRLDLTVNTVKSYVRTAYQKVGVSRRTEAVRWGVEHGLLAVPVLPTAGAEPPLVTAPRSR